ncbi:alcohol dehydrogenase catalytic domain-containing protein [uncultured Gilliamella sp.]|jgi:Threonine dehydrogenase and related Zn-dependent dehydrogenases|uniref:alcohol dehydrogenase catalytic domain-containing protein n=1 Tax=uncultured Gilliamella sp. TaxID=1193505 RepID=UPI0025F30BF2|nr:alcohol dehydrogenase catalytic domain-containing protein [uncultured Gilliamella sp.]
MITQAVRLYGKNDLRLESFELPTISDDEVLVSVIVDSMCMSSLKLVNQGENHKKTPPDLKNNPIIIGHECCGEILQVGKNWQHKFKVGQKYVVQANLQLANSPYCVGYSYPYTGGCATYMIINHDVLKQDCLIPYDGQTYFEGALIEPLSCIIGAFNANYHLKPNSYEHIMGIKPNGELIILGGTGPMGMLAIDYALGGPIKPKKVVITGRSKEKIEHLKTLYQSRNGIELEFVDISNVDDQLSLLKTKSTKGCFDDIFIFLPSQELIYLASQLLAFDGCLNFFAGPQDKNFSAEINFYDVHYNFTHIVGTSGGNTDDMRSAVKLIESGAVDVAKIVSHIMGINQASEITQIQDKIKGGKKLVYTHKQFALKSLDSLSESSEDIALQKILNKSKGIWSKEAEDFVLNYFPDIES